MISLAQKINLNMYTKGSFTLTEVYRTFPNEKKESIRARIYDNIGKYFEKIERGIYRVIKDDNECLIIEGDGRDLSAIEDESIDCIITDHPWDSSSNKGGNRNFTSTYNCFKYTLQDFIEKARVLKEGCFLVEILPEESESNYEYLYNIKQLAKQAGLLYYSKVPWKKGAFVSNTGRKSGNVEDIMFFTKGKARKLRRDEKKIKKFGDLHFMSGTNKMLPTNFDIDAVSKKDKIHQSEKPKELILAILDYITKENELVLDQFAGSGVVGESCLIANRDCILIEMLKENIEKIANRLFDLASKIQVITPSLNE